MRRAFVLGITAIVIVASVDLGACGDKFLRVGRSARFRRYAAVHPATILIYRPAHSTRAGIEELKAMLKQAGHRPVAVESGTNIADALAAVHYDVVIADYADAGQLRSEIQSASSRPDILPILYKPTKAVEAKAEQQYTCLIKPHAMTKYDALAEIDRLIDLRSKK
jgi:DNA-binding NtrC family response regulator